MAERMATVVQWIIQQQRRVLCMAVDDIRPYDWSVVIPASAPQQYNSNDCGMYTMCAMHAAICDTEGNATSIAGLTDSDINTVRIRICLDLLDSKITPIVISHTATLSRRRQRNEGQSSFHTMFGMDFNMYVDHNDDPEPMCDVTLLRARPGETQAVQPRPM